MRTLMSISTIIADRITRIKVLYDTMVQNSKLNKKTWYRSIVATYVAAI